MPAPPPTMERTERELDGHDIKCLSRLDEARKELAESYRAIMKSEQASYSEVYGYVYRYDIAKSIVDGKKESVPIRSILVLWTSDCKSFEIATYPTFDLSARRPK